MVITIANVLVISAIAYLIWKKEEHRVRRFFWPAFVLKMAGGIGLGLLYFHYYKLGDTLGYFSDGLKLSDLARNDLMSYLRFLWSMESDPDLVQQLLITDPRALFFTKFVSVANLVSGDNYWVSASYFSLFSFLASWFLVTELEKQDSRFATPACLALLFFPTVVLWTSGLVKESLAMASLYFIVMVFLKLFKGRTMKYSHWVMLPVAGWILWGLKYYYLAVLLPVIATVLIMHLIVEPRLKSGSRFLKTVLWIVIFMVPVSIASIVHPNFYPERFLQVIVSNYQAFIAISSPEDVIQFSSLTPDGWSILKNAPKALYSGIFRPFIWEAGTTFQLFAALENLFLFLLLFFSLANLRNKDKHPLLWPCVLYCVLLCVFLTLSTPNFGTLSRYRVGFLPFLILSISYNNPIINRVDGFLQRNNYRLVK